MMHQVFVRLAIAASHPPHLRATPVAASQIHVIDVAHARGTRLAHGSHHRRPVLRVHGRGRQVGLRIVLASPRHRAIRKRRLSAGDSSALHQCVRKALLVALRMRVTAVLLVHVVRIRVLCLPVVPCLLQLLRLERAALVSDKVTNGRATVKAPLGDARHARRLQLRPRNLSSHATKPLMPTALVHVAEIERILLQPLARVGRRPDGRS